MPENSLNLMVLLSECSIMVGAGALVGILWGALVFRKK